MAAEGGEIDEGLSSRTNNSSYPRDLLQGFAGDGVDRTPAAQLAVGDMGEIELGLSLGGCYGAEPKDKRLVRASSMTLSMFPGERIDFPAVTTPLTRTCSLPTETEEERRKRKELEFLKRREAKRKRSEKRAVVANGNRREDNLDEDSVSKAANGGVVFPAEASNWAAASGGRGGVRPASQGSIGSQGSSSSGVSDFESRPVQGNSSFVLLFHVNCNFISCLISTYFYELC